ncbi:unnamed protein product [Mytilus edulis]|uniref:Ig-like domain-containing protein n=1 Tax=Mytilus edulis TaxID=6550 RepID=A0A8S3QLI4_MYTED|nr:unnamed protein product [Mytilus edulis]
MILNDDIKETEMKKNEEMYIYQSKTETHLFLDNWSLSLKPDFENIRVDKSMTIKCQVHNLPGDTTITNVSWYLNQNKLLLEPNKYSKRLNENPSLTIKNFKLSDEGTYKCEIENDVGLKKSGSTYLAFIGEVKSTASLSDVDITLLLAIIVNVHGKNLHLGVDKKCEDIRKQRHQEEFRESFSRFKQIFMDEDTLTEPTLTLAAKIDDEGIYVCRATNEAGVGLSNESKLTYIGKHSIKVHRGNADVPSLTIIDFNQEDEGIYVCKATNEAGEAVSNKSILKYIEPPTVIVSPDRQNVVKGQAQTLNCSVSGTPPPIILWMRVENGVEAIINLPSEKYTGEMLMFCL